MGPTVVVVADAALTVKVVISAVTPFKRGREFTFVASSFALWS